MGASRRVVGLVPVLDRVSLTSVVADELRRSRREADDGQRRSVFVAPAVRRGGWAQHALRDQQISRGSAQSDGDGASRSAARILMSANDGSGAPERPSARVS